MLDSKHQVTAHRFQRYARYPLDFVKSLQEHGKRNFGFQACQWRSEAKMNAMSKRNMAVLCPLDIEGVRIGKLPLITVGGADPGKHHFPPSPLLNSPGGIRH